ncbi:hypothetical protein [uncultured Mailhella sp.]|uniref:hypothetical protein n=1 Tax=uncultured Mailhella sp. TaxID=1981031 RepID=UPI0025D5BFE9|nr:hypothetical protein [uncultured Mailhella sp.]
MRLIIKNKECSELVEWKRNNPDKKLYTQLDSTVRQPIRKALLKEQFGLCAFCCDRVPKGSGRNAHLLSQHAYPHKSLLWENLVASCEKKYCCDQEQRGRSLFFTPLMPECEKEIKFFVSGRIEGLTDRAKEAIKILGLDNHKLCAIRRRAIQLLAQREGCDPAEHISTLDPEERHLLIKAINTPDEDGLLPAFAPILVSYIKSLP